ncbi:MAG: ATP-binding protein [Bacteroides cellulosilyticus]
MYAVRDKYKNTWNRISGPLLDRIDLQIEVVPVPFEKMSDAHPGEASSIIRERVISARQIQGKADMQIFRGVYCNAQNEQQTTFPIWLVR